ncbi:MAG: IgA Peptidase M64 [Ignavibacteriaceae bacterium]|nr:IgA Peptidase M64 [Ignavibacteriaceae bacterium]
MKNLIIVSFLTSLLISSAIGQDFETFNKYFIDETMRIDYHHVGDAKDELITLDQIYKYGIWAGSRVNLIDEMNLGRYCVKIYDAASNELIYSKGFDSYFGEYKTSTEGLEGIKKTFHESAIIPYPKNKIVFAMERRDSKQNLFEFFRREIDPADIMIIRDEVKDKMVTVYDAETNGETHNRVDVVILGEGYTIDERTKFEKDLKYFTEVFFGLEPYKSNQEKFNIHGVYKPSGDSGIDEPPADQYSNTVVNCTFNSMGSERYILTEDNKAVRDLAAHVPYDAIYIMVNHPRYGGGGIYNFFCTFTTDNQFRDYLFLHEFGHSFSGLADEYYTSDVQYNDFYPVGLDPLEPNITALTDPTNIKWKEFLTPGIEIPSKWDKAKYDSMDYKWQAERREMNKKTAQLKRERQSSDVIKAAEDAYARKDKEHSDLVDSYLRKNTNYGKVGAFEGAGYVANGMYRPMLDCIMFSKGERPFCKVCEAHIMKVIEQYTE